MTSFSLSRRRVLPGFAPTLGFTLFYLTGVVLIPLLALVLRPFEMGLDGFWNAVTNPRVLAALRLSFGMAVAAAAIDSVFGFVIAWVLTRYRFPGVRLMDALIDLPFAFVLEPKPRRPLARAVRELPAGLDASIRGPLAGLIGMAEGTLDGDALFFSRVLWVEGDVSAALALRNAIDDARIDFGALLFGGLGPVGARLADVLRERMRARPSASEDPAWN